MSQEEISFSFLAFIDSNDDLRMAEINVFSIFACYKGVNQLTNIKSGHAANLCDCCLE